MHHTSRKRAGEFQRVADGDHQLSGAKRGGVAGRRGFERIAVCSNDAQGGKVAARVAGGDAGLEAAAVPELDFGLGGARHVGVGQNEAAGRPDDAGASTPVSAVEHLHGGAPEALGDVSESAHG